MTSLMDNAYAAAPEPGPHRDITPALLPVRGSGNLSYAVAPPPNRRLPVWDRPVPHSEHHAPALWLLGAHGGAGVSTLAHLLAPAADCGHCWPARQGGESPFVAVVARETIDGLSHAHDLLRQFHCGLTGHNTVLVGLITCAHRPGKPPRAIRRYLDVLGDLVPDACRWRIGWQDDWPLTDISHLPIWTPGDIRPAKGTDPLAAVRGLGESLLDTLKTAATPQCHR